MHMLIPLANVVIDFLLKRIKYNKIKIKTFFGRVSIGISAGNWKQGLYNH